jgi:hypothetical protein
MKKHFVYELYTELGPVEYVGETTNPTRRFYDHTYKTGKFYKRNDIKMRIADMFDTKKEAWNRQCELQTMYGLITDGEKIAVTKRGRFVSEETKLKNKLNAMGKKASEETKLKMSLAQSNRREMEKRCSTI